MSYALLKTLHLMSMVIWLGGMITFAIIGANTDETNAAQLRLLFGRIVTLAMLGTWIAGLSLASVGGWFEVAAWPWIKIAGAFVLSGVHGIIAGRLTRRAIGKTHPDVLLSKVAPIITVLTMACLIFVAVTKLF